MHQEVETQPGRNGCYAIALNFPKPFEGESRMLRKMIVTFLCTFALSATLYGGFNLFEPKASASAGVCCAFSSDCPGADICYEAAGGQADCCDTTTPTCKGSSYCRKTGDEIDTGGSGH